MENKFQILIRYNYRKKEYFIILRDNEIFFVCYDNKEIKFELDKEEAILASKVYSAFLVNEDKSIKVDQIKINNNEYYIFYDMQSGNYFWNNTNNNFEDNIILNMKYNHQSEIMYVIKHDKNSKLKEKVYTKLILFGTTVVVATALASINPLTLSNATIVNKEVSSEVQEPTQDTSSENITPIYDWNKIEIAIEQNSNLSNEEKELLYNLKFLFDAHHDHMDLNLIESRLSTLSIEYSTDGMKGSIAGTYDSNNNVIELYHYPKEDDEHTFKNTDKSNFIHELLHVFQRPDKECGVLSEASNELEARNLVEILEDKNIIEKDSHVKGENEDIRIFGKGYSDVIPVYYILTQFMTDDEILDFQYNGDIDVIANALSRLGSKEETYELLTKIKNNKFEIGEGEDERRTIYKELNNYYKKLKGKNLYDDLEFAMIIIYTNPDFNYDDAVISDLSKSEIAFTELVKNVLMKEGEINSGDKADIYFNGDYFAYRNLFFENGRENTLFYPCVATNNADNLTQRYVSIKVSDELQGEFDRINQVEKKHELEFDRE